MSIWSGAVVLVTGGTGSLGTAFVDHLLRTENPQSVRILARSEHRLAEMERRLSDERIRTCKGDVRDYDRLLDVMGDVNIVVHAAALKRVEGANDASETVKTNVDGSRNVVRAATERHVERVMGISSDKACQAVTLYGATKLAMEHLFLEPHGRSRTAFAICRYGNVCGSAGSIVPLFREQARHGTLTVTDRRATRFWITLDQAVRWVKRRIELMEPGRVYVPVLPSVHVLEVARAIAPTAQVRVIGMRGLEKLHEQMIGFDESRTARSRTEADTLDYFVLGGDPTGSPEFTYSSEENTWWLNCDEIRDRLPEVA